MAEIIENTTEKIPSNGKTNAALSLGIIGTALSALNGAGGLLGLMGNKNLGGQTGMTNEELYLERTQCQNYLATTEQYYKGKIEENERLNNAFFSLYKNDVDNSFNLYKNQRDSADALSSRIDEVNKKVDVMAAIRPYQDALIENKIEKAEILAQYNLDKRTCRMITGQLVLPSTPTVTGYGSYYPWSSTTTTTTTS